MHALDRHFGDCRALVIDANPTSRSILAAQLRDFGLSNVVQCSRLGDARRHLENRPFDIVLCEQHFPGEKYSGQDLLDDLRRANLLPLSTVFVMITGEATYDKVAEAAESALDSYLLKPHTASALGERLRQARDRKKSLREIYEAIEAEDYDAAAEHCLRRFEARGRYWLYAARIGAELLLRLGRHGDAQKLYEAVIASQALPWAKLGVARAQLDANQGQLARRTLESLIAEQPTYADAYDVMGRTQIEQGQLAQALATFRQASELTPASIARLQKQGMLAFYMGERDEAAKAMERATTLGISSKMFDYQTLVLLGFVRFEQRDTKGLQRCIDNLGHALEKSPASRRLQRFVEVLQVLVAMLEKQVGAAVAGVRQLAQEVRDPAFDMEAGCNMAALVALLTAAELQLEDAERWIDAVGLRFCTTKGLSELLARTAEAHPPFAERLRQCHGRVAELAEKAMAHSLSGDPTATVRALVSHGGQTQNAKLIDMARLTLQRYAGKVNDAAALSAAVEQLRERFVSASGQPSLGGGSRQAGGLALRAGASGPAADTLRREAAEQAAAQAAVAPQNSEA